MVLAGRRNQLLLFFLLFLLPLLLFLSPAHGRGRLDNPQRSPAPKRRLYIRKPPPTRGTEQYSRCDATVKRLSSAVLSKEDEVLALEKEAMFLGRLAANTVRKGLHCLSLRLTIQYYNNHLQQQTHTSDPSILENNEFYHYIIYSENILAVAAVINSTTKNAKEPRKHVFHILTNGLNYPAMQMWFWSYPPERSIVEVRNFDSVMNIFGAHTMRKRLEIHPSQTTFKALEKDNLLKQERQEVLQQYLPEIFPKLEKVFVLHDDVVIMKDLSSLRDKTFGASVISSSDSCNSSDDDGVWCSCAIIVNLQERRNQRLMHRTLLELKDTAKYDSSLPHSDTTNVNDMPLESAINVFDVDKATAGSIDDAAVIHYSGHKKPWLELGTGRYKSFWTRFVNYGNPFLQECNIHN